MRILLFSLLCLPFLCNAQINRSANEVARERVKEYIATKLFKDQVYKPVSYGELIPQKQRDTGLAWLLTHQFEITDSQFVADKKIAVRKAHSFSFYLDKKMKVIAAESYRTE